MDELYAEVLRRVNRRITLEPVGIPPELAETVFPLRALELRLHNWSALRLRKVYCMRLKVRVPSLDVLGMAFYPLADYDVPIFQFDLSLTRKKLVTYVNFIAMSDAQDYLKRCVEPLRPVCRRLGGLPAQKMPDWMQAYRNDGTVYSIPDRKYLEPIKRCVLDYADIYLELLCRAQPIEGEDDRKKIERVHETFRDDLVTRDRSQKMLGKIIGKKKAGRIFNELLI